MFDPRRSNALSGTIPDALAASISCPSQTIASSQVGLAGNLLTGGTPLSLSGSGCIKEITLQASTTVCTAGSAATTGSSGVKWENATCALCQPGTSKPPPSSSRASATHQTAAAGVCVLHVHRGPAAVSAR